MHFSCRCRNVYLFSSFWRSFISSAMFFERQKMQLYYGTVYYKYWILTYYFEEEKMWDRVTIAMYDYIYNAQLLCKKRRGLHLHLVIAMFSVLNKGGHWALRSYVIIAIQTIMSKFNSRYVWVHKIIHVNCKHWIRYVNFNSTHVTSKLQRIEIKGQFIKQASWCQGQYNRQITL